MKLKDFLKQFENEDPETEIGLGIRTGDEYPRMDPDFEICKRFIPNQTSDGGGFSQRTFPFEFDKDRGYRNKAIVLISYKR